MGGRAGIGIRAPFGGIGIEDKLSIAHEERSIGQGRRLGAVARFTSDTLKIDGIQLRGIWGGMTSHKSEWGMAANAEATDTGHILIGDGEGGEEDGVAGGIGHHATGPSIEGEVVLVPIEAIAMAEDAAVGILEFAAEGQIAWLGTFEVVESGESGMAKEGREGGEGEGSDETGEVH